ncbi:hypothetical protein GCM10010381_14370 [Streptomyces xantholiticus]|nr:hypothetical protein GCM10010381_14370 [Streptomyces xantholiticus]
MGVVALTERVYVRGAGGRAAARAVPTPSSEAGHAHDPGTALRAVSSDAGRAACAVLPAAEVRSTLERVLGIPARRQA